MKLIHCADLHLDSVMDSRLPAECARIRRQELLLAFGRIADAAVAENARAVLISGDLFDTGHPSPSAVRYVLDTVASHPAVDFLLLYGNHAGTFRFGDEIPENLRFFGEHTYAGYRYGQIAIYGCEDSRVPLPNRLSPDDCNIVMLHGQVTESGREAGDITLPDLRSKNIDYLALGHLHSLRTEQLDVRGVYCYPGCPEGRGFDETGDKGFLLLDASPAGIRQTFCLSAKRRFRTVPVDLSGCASQRGTEEAIASAVEEIPAEDCVRVVLCGARNAGAMPDTAQCRAALDGRFFYLEIKDETAFTLDPETYAHDFSLRGEFVRTVLRHCPDRESADRILAAGLAALDGEEVTL